MNSEVKAALNEIDKARAILNRYSDDWVLAFDIQHDDLKQATSFVWHEGNFNSCVGLMLRTLVTFSSDIIVGTAKLDEEEEN